LLLKVRLENVFLSVRPIVLSLARSTMFSCTAAASSSVSVHRLRGLAFDEIQPALAKTRRRGRPPRRVGHNFLLCLSTRKQDVLRFLIDPAVPFTNNLAEQDGRMMKLRQLISGGFRSEDGAKDFAVIRSVLSAARKQGWNMLQNLAGEPAHLMAHIRLA
jgi:transposase